MASKKKDARNTQPSYATICENNEVNSLKEIIEIKDHIINDYVDDYNELRQKYDISLAELEEAYRRIKELENNHQKIEKETQYTTNTDMIDTSVYNEEADNFQNTEKKPYTETAENDVKDRYIFTKIDAGDSSESIGSVDSGVHLSSLTKLIDDRIDKKLEEGKSSNEKERVETFLGKRTAAGDRTLPSTLDARSLNIIIHGIQEESTEKDQGIIDELFHTVGLKCTSTPVIDRLGSKSNERTRPIRLCMATKSAKLEFMSGLGRLKHGPDKFKKISITDDYTKEERAEIRRWVEEAQQRTKNEIDYVWKVRGSPKNNIRLIRIKA